MAHHNAPAIKLLTDRYSLAIKTFNNLPDPVSEADSGAHFDLYKELETLATEALTRAPKYKPSGNRLGLIPARDLGNVRMLMLRHLTPAERARYDEIQNEITALTDKYED